MQTDVTVKGWAGEIPVYCAFDQAVAIADVKPNPKNPNMHPDEQIELMAAIHAGMTHVPVDFQHYDSEDAEMADLVADNKIAELSEMDEKMLAEIFASIDPDETALTGYTDDEILKIGDILADSIMLDIDEVGSKSEVSTHKLRIDKTVIELAEDEHKLLMAELNRYVDMNGTTFGFVRWLLNDD